MLRLKRLKRRMSSIMLSTGTAFPNCGCMSCRLAPLKRINALLIYTLLFRISILRKPYCWLVASSTLPAASSSSSWTVYREGVSALHNRGSRIVVVPSQTFSCPPVILPVGMINELTGFPSVFSKETRTVASCTFFP